MRVDFLQDVWDILCDSVPELQWAGAVRLEQGTILLRVWEDGEPIDKYVRLYREYLEHNLETFKWLAEAGTYRADLNAYIIEAVDEQDACNFDAELADLYLQQFGLGEIVYG